MFKISLSGKRYNNSFPGGLAVKEKNLKYLRYGTYVLMVFLFFMMLFSFPETQEQEYQEPLEKNRIIPENLTNEQELEASEEESQIIEIKEQLYMGIENDQIAIYVKDLSGRYILKEVLPYPVKSVYYEELKQKVPFSDEYTKRLLLEYFTS
jgi:hypothetical protein